MVLLSFSRKRGVSNSLSIKCTVEKEVFATKWYRGIVNGLQESFSFGYVMFYKLNLRICIRSIFLPFREEKLIKYSIYYSVTKVCVGIAYLI